MNKPSELLRSLPSIDKVLQVESLALLIERVGQKSVKLEARAQLDKVRNGIVNGDEAAVSWLASSDFLQELCSRIESKVNTAFSSTLIPVFNLTGTVVHTNLGRARLPEEAVKAMVIAASNATNLEYDLISGKRGDRDAHLEQAVCAMTGAEAATVVNNNAAAVL